MALHAIWAPKCPCYFFAPCQKLLLGFDVYCAAYVDDIIIFSDTWEEHLSHLRTVLSRIRAANLTLSPSKCCFAVAEVDYLGHHVGLGHVQPLTKKVQAVLDFPPPPTVGSSSSS